MQAAHRIVRLQEACASILFEVLRFRFSGLTARFWLHPPRHQKSRPALINADREEIVGVTTNRGEEVRFDSPGGALRNGVISARVRGSDYMINIPDVNRLWVARVETSVARTVGLVVGIAAGTLVTVVAIALLTKQSCPFV